MAALKICNGQTVTIDKRTWDSLIDRGVFLEDAFAHADSTIKVLHLDIQLANEQIKWRDANILELRSELNKSKENNKSLKKQAKIERKRGRKEGGIVGFIVGVILVLLI